MKLNTYLNFGGNCAEAFQYYEKHLGARTGMVMTFDQAPGAQNLDPKTAKGVLYGQIRIGETEVMASDVPDGRWQPTRSSYLCIDVESDAEAERIYNALKDGGEVFMELRRPSLRTNMRSCATSSAFHGWSFTRSRWGLRNKRMTAQAPGQRGVMRIRSRSPRSRIAKTGEEAGTATMPRAGRSRSPKPGLLRRAAPFAAKR